MGDLADNQWIASLPKAELHMHLDGSLQAERMLQLAKKNSVTLPYQSLEDVTKAYQFSDLQSFLDLYYLGASVLYSEDDFYTLMMDYLLKCREQNIVHCEIMIEPQTYLPRGIGFETFMAGFKRAIQEAEQEWGQSTLLILSLLKHCTEQECIEVLEMADAWRDDFVALGMASAEVGNPPEKFQRLYKLGQSKGYQLTIHAGEEGAPQGVWDSLNLIQATRIDHGVRSIEDDALVEYLATHQIPLTVCPLSNIRLRVYKHMQDHCIVTLFNRGVKVTINSDDPAYFGGYLNENYQAVADQFSLNKLNVLQIAENAFQASYLAQEEKNKKITQLKLFANQSQVQL